MSTLILIVAAIILTIVIVWLINKFVSSKAKPFVLILLWALIAYLAYLNVMSVYEPIQFNKVRNKRYAMIIENLKDLRHSQLAHRQVTGKFEKNFDNLVKFIDTAQFTITQRRDSSVIDKEMTRRYGVDTYKDIVIVDTLGFVPVKDSLFKNSDRYKTMINIPEGAGEPGSKFVMDAGFVERNNVKVPVFEVKVDKSVILFDRNEDLVAQEKEVVSVDGVNGPTLKVGSMDEVNTNGNWPKIYGSNDE